MSSNILNYSEKSLTEIMYNIYRSDLPESEKERNKKELIKRISNISTVKETFTSRLKNASTIKVFKDSKEAIKFSKDGILAKMGDTYSDPHERLKEFIKLITSLKEGDHKNYFNLLKDILELVEFENSFVADAQNFVSTFEKKFTIGEEYYKCILENMDTTEITNTGSLRNISLQNFTDLDENDAFACSILTGIFTETREGESEQTLHKHTSERVLKILMNCSNLRIRAIGSGLFLNNERRKTWKSFYKAHKILFTHLNLLCDRMSLKHFSTNMIVLATPRIATLHENFADYFHEYFTTRVSIYEGTNDLWIGEATIKRFRSLSERVKSLGESQVIFTKGLNTFILKEFQKNSKFLKHDLLRIYYKLKLESKVSADNSPARLNLLPTVALSQPKFKDKAKVMGDTKHDFHELGYIEHKDEEDLEIKEETQLKGPGRSFSAAAAAPAAPAQPSKKVSKDLKIYTLKEDNTPLKSMISPIGEPGWTLVRDFSYHERVSRWNFPFDPSLDRIPFSDYAESTEEPLKSYVKHALVPSIDELIYDPSFNFHERLGEGDDARERRHLIARIKYPNGESEEGIITYAFVKKGSKKICIHRHFSKQSKRHLISQQKEELFARINSEIREAPFSLSETSPDNLPAFESERSKPSNSFGYIIFSIPKLGINITVFKHTL